MTTRALGYLLRELHAKNGRDLTDRELLERFCSAREEAAFGVLVQRHGPMVLAVCRRILRNSHDAEDAFQATFLVLVRNARSIRKKASLASWLHGVARRVALRAETQAAARRRHEILAQNPTPRAPVDEMIEHEIRSVLDEEIESLPEKHRAAVVLCYLERKTYQQAAGEQGWPKSSLASRLDRARRMLQERLLHRGLVAPGVLAGAFLTAERAPAEVPARLTLEVVRAATATLTRTTGADPLVSTGVAGLADGVAAGLSAAKIKLALVVSVLSALVGSAAIAHFAKGKLQVEPEHAQAASAPHSSDADRDRGQATAKDLYGDPLPTGAIARLGTVRYRGVPGYWPAAFDAEGKTYVVGEGSFVLAADSDVVLADVQTGKVLRRFPTSGRVDAVAISPDGKTVAAGGGPTDHVVRIWDAATGREIRQIRSDLGGFGQILLFTPDGKKLARESGHRSTSLWDLETGKEMWRRGLADDKPVTFSPRAFSPKGDVLIATEERRGPNGKALVFVETATGRELRRIAGISDQAGLAFSRDRKLLACEGQGQGWVLQLWDLDAGKKLRDIPGLRSTNEHFAFSPDGKTLAWSSEDKCIRLLDVATGNELRRVGKGLETATRLHFLGDNKTLAFCPWNESALRVWDLEHDRELYPLDAHRGRVFDALYIPDGRTIISASMDGTIRYWDRLSGKEIHCTEAHTGGAWCLAMTPDGKTLASASLNDRTVRLWDAASRQEVGRLAPPKGAHALAITPDGKSLLTASLGPEEDRGVDRSYALRLWDIATGKELRHWSTRSAHCPVALSPDGSLMATDNAGSIAVWKLTTGLQQRDLQLPKGPPREKQAPDWETITDVAFSPDCKMLVAAKRDGGIKSPRSAIIFWELASGKQRLSVEFAPSHGKIVSFSTDGRYLAVGADDHKVYVLDTSTGETIRQFEGHHGEITSVAFAPDGKSIATGSTDTTILVWNVDDLPRHDRKVPPHLSPKELDALWSDLADADAAKAYRAIVTMTEAPGTVAYLAQRLKPIAPADAALLGTLIAELDSQQFTQREKAAEELAKLADLAEPALKKALATNPSQEVQRRAEAILRKLERPVTAPEMLRSLRALEVLERIETPEARELLTSMAGGAPASHITQAAQAALQRHRR